MPKKPNPTKELITRRRRQFLVHSFVYYVLSDNLISDNQYDQWCKELYDLQKAHPTIASKCPYHKICKKLDQSASGFFIRIQDYPDEIAKVSFMLVAQKNNVNWVELAKQYGYIPYQAGDERKG